MERFTLFGVDQDELDRARQSLSQAVQLEQDGLYLTGRASRETLDALAAQGFLLNIAWDKPPPEAPPELADEAGFDLLSDEGWTGGQLQNTNDDGPTYGDIQVLVPLTPERRDWLEAQGIRVKHKTGRSRYLATINPGFVQEDAPDWLRVDDFQVDVCPSQGYQVAPSPRRDYAAGASLESADDDEDVALLSDSDFDGGFATAAAAPQMAAPEDRTYDVACHEPAQLEGLRQRLEGDGRVKTIEVGPDRLRLTFSEDDEQALVAELSRLKAVVATVEAYVPPELQVSYAVEALLGRPGLLPKLAWRGKGQILGIADSGIDADHPDLKGRVTVKLRVQPASDRDPLGHGTHVASLAAGDGTASDGKLTGLASEATIFMQSIADSLGKLVPGVGLRPLLQEAYDAGVRVQNYSWGAAVAGRYTLDSSDIDGFIYDNPDLLVIVAGGNSGQQGAGAEFDLRSLTSPASAKNCLTVGASCSPRPDGPYANKTWIAYDGGRAPRFPPMSTLPLTGNPKVLAALSSRGPSDDGRIKPDMVAPGVGIAGALSADKTGPRHPYPGNDKYQFLSGTSMAAPLVAGAAVVLRQYLIEEKGLNPPSAAVLKAALVNGAEWLGDEAFEDKKVGRPNFHQGFGLISLSRILPDESTGFGLEVVDVGNTSPAALQAGAGGRAQWTRTFTVKAGLPFSVTLAWTDPPSRGLQHELDLVVTGPDGVRYIGNAELLRLAIETFDNRNNVEQVRIADPAPGDWKVQVSARSTYRGPQGFGLAITGSLQVASSFNNANSLES